MNIKVNQADHEDVVEFKQAVDDAIEALERASNLLRLLDPKTYERWKAYGKQVTDEFVTAGPNLTKIAKSIEEVEDEDEGGEEEEEE